MKKCLTRLLTLLLSLALLLTPAYALTVDQALELLETYYYYDIPDEAYEAQTVDELIRLLGDPYTSYMSAEEYRAFLDALEGETGLVGIGVTIQRTDEGILIVDTISGGSAREAGLRSGDLIVEVDGVSCVPADDAVVSRIAGDEGTQVTVTVLRDGVRTQYTLTRRLVVIPNTEVRLLDGGIGYIDCNSFGSDTGREFAQMVRDNDAKVRLWLLDLRGNGGGYTNAAVEMLNALLGPGYYLYYQSGDNTVTPVPAQKHAATAKPVIVLTDGSSASASELVASGLRDEGRSVTVGGRTYGKGVAQAMLDGSVLPDYFDEDSLKLTVHRFYSGGCNTTDKIGVIPTLLVDSAYTNAVSLALCGREDEARVCVLLGAHPCYLDPDTDPDVLAALFAALPPQAQVYRSDGGEFVPCSAAEAAASLNVGYASRWFTDVADSKYADAINAMGTYGLLRGNGSGQFSPDTFLARAELCAMLAQVLNVSYQGGTLFSDVSQDDWYGPSVNAMAYLGLVNGVGGGRFNPGGRLTQEEFFTIMGRAARFLNLRLDDYGLWVEDKADNLTLAQRGALMGYSDWARTSMAVLAWGVDEALDGTGALLYAPLKELSPKAPILREEAAAGMYAVLHGLGILL